MKKVRITLNASSTGKKFYLFPSAESLYLWVCALERNESLSVPGLEELVLEPGGFIEAELQGFEYVYEDAQKFRRLDLVRLGKTEQPKNAAGTMVTTHSGWVMGSLLPMKTYSDQNVTIELLSADDKGKLDLPTLFKDDVPQDESIDVEFEPDEEK